MNLIEVFLHLQEVNRIVQGLSKRSGKPSEHVDALWKATEKEVLVSHTFGVTDSYRHIGNIVRAKLGVKPDPANPDEKDDTND